MANFHSEAESENGDAHSYYWHPGHGIEEASGKPKAMKQPEEKGHAEPAGAAASVRPENILQCDEDDARGDHRFDHLRGQPNEIKDREGQGDGVRERESRDDFEELPKTGHRECERSDEEEMVVTSQNMGDPVTHVIARHLPRSR